MEVPLNPLHRYRSIQQVDCRSITVHRYRSIQQVDCWLYTEIN